MLSKHNIVKISQYSVTVNFRREESLPLIKRKLLSGLLDFAAAELQLQVYVA